MGRDKKVFLVVDDEEVIRRVLKRYFDTQGVRVVLAADAHEALEAVGREKPDVMLLDIKMPGMDGIELLRRLRDIEGAPPVLMLTAVEDEETASAAMELGARDYLTKPIDLDYLDRSASLLAMLGATPARA